VRGALSAFLVAADGNGIEILVAKLSFAILVPKTF